MNVDLTDPVSVFRRLAEIHVSTRKRLADIDRLQAEQRAEDAEWSTLSGAAWDLLGRENGAVEAVAVADGLGTSHVVVVEDGLATVHRLQSAYAVKPAPPRGNGRCTRVAVEAAMMTAGEDGHATLDQHDADGPAHGY